MLNPNNPGNRASAEAETREILEEQKRQEEKRKQDRLAVLKRELDDVKRKLDLEKRKLAELEEKARTLQAKEAELSNTAKTAHTASQDTSVERDYEKKRGEIEGKIDVIKRAKNALETKLRVSANGSSRGKAVPAIDDAVITREQTALDKLRNAHKALKERIVELTRELAQAKDDEVRLDREERETTQEIEDLQNRQTQVRDKHAKEEQETARIEAEQKAAREELARHEAEEKKLEDELVKLTAQHEAYKREKKAHSETADRATSEADHVGNQARENERLVNKAKTDIRALEQKIDELEGKMRQI